MQIGGLKSFMDGSVLEYAVDRIHKLFKKQEAHIRAGNATSNHSSAVQVGSMSLASKGNVSPKRIPSMLVMIAAALLVGGSFASLAIYAKRPRANNEVYLLHP